MHVRPGHDMGTRIVRPAAVALSKACRAFSIRNCQVDSMISACIFSDSSFHARDMAM